MKEQIKKDYVNNSVGGGTYKHKATIMLTGTIDCLSFNKDESKHKINVALDNTLERLAQYENAISRYITESNFTEIVFVENSGYPFPFEKYEQLAIDFGKRFEFLYRKLSDKEVAVMQEKGKSWGEADLIDYAIDNSKLIAETEVIYKCTGRVYLKNSKKIIKKANLNSEFFRYPNIDWAVTAFFKVVKEDYKNYLYGLKELVNDNCGSGQWFDTNFIEVVFYRTIRETSIQVKGFNVYPQLEGISAGCGGRYEMARWKYFIYDVLPYSLKKRWRIK